ncbi:hypothetical protein GCM10028803_08630 [Larkinella knui]|uniref:Thioredoxin n=1 Tax=Larkinella knui TaxID=2025310 RepID=A0A3P1CJI9_9BACT|nr:thioredoxin family protein [Larkinella knui]RRB13477.1 thioredoxin [Larkinella knui]
MANISWIKLKDSHLKPLQTRSEVLLIFMPPEQIERSQRAEVRSLADSLQQHMGDQVRILKIEESTQADVFRSFDITQTPAFILIRQGIELWRHVGMVDKDLLTSQSERLITD